MTDEKIDPHGHGCACCLDCDKRWYAVWPLGADDLECPRCHGTNTEREFIDRDEKGHAVNFRKDT